MATDSPRKSAAATGRWPKTKARAVSVLDKMAPSELATVLRALLKKHPDLRPEAESIAVEMVSSPSVENIAEDVLDAVTSLGIDSFHERAGKQSWGYVEPTEVAWELLGEAVEDVMKRRMDLGLHEAAQAICCGIVLGLHKGEGGRARRPLG